MQSEALTQIKKEQAAHIEKLNKEKKVKIKAKCFIRPLSTGGMKVFKPGDEVEVAESEAKEFCETSFSGYTPEAGTKPTAFPQPKITRAEYVR